MWVLVIMGCAKCQKAVKEFGGKDTTHRDGYLNLGV
jgi:hypothetical protein